MLLGRDAELGRIRNLLDAARAGRPEALVLHGGAGIGKTALVDAARASGDDLTVLAARPIESEASLPFAALRDLLEPVLDQVEALPAAQATALAGALALAPPAPGDRLGVCVAALGVLEHAAAARPVLVLVDDLQWTDGPSLECVVYAARRARGPIAFLLAERDGEGPSRAGPLPRAAVGPLADDAAYALLGHVAPELAAPVRAAVAAAAAGNPLAIVELPATLSAEQRAGSSRLELPLAPQNGLRQVFAGRVDALSAPARDALLVAAAAQTGALAPVLAACATLGLTTADLLAAETAGLISVSDERVTFAHPLVRGGAYHGASGQARRRAHAALAGAIADPSRAWHLAAAAVGPDDDAVRALEELAGLAAARRGYAVAADALERAARLSADPGAAAGRLTGAAGMALAAGEPARVAALAEEATERAQDPVSRAAAGHLLGLVAMWGGRVGEAAERLERSADGAASVPLLAAAILADASFASSAAGDCARALAVAERAAALLDPGAPAAVRAPVLAVLGWSLVLRGQSRRARPVLAEVARLGPEIDPLSPVAQVVLSSVNVRLPFEDYEGALAECERLAALAGDSGSLFALPNALVTGAVAAHLLGRWEGLDAWFGASIAASEDTGQWGPHALAASVRARVRAARGDAAGARADAEVALALAASADAPCFAVYGHYALGFLALSAGRIADAIGELEETARRAAATGLEEPTMIPWAPDLVEAYARAGREDDARAVLATLTRLAEGADTHIAAAVTARGRGLVEPDFDEHFTTALAEHDRAGMPFERARTLLAWGMRLHRARRRVAARERLREAEAIFTGLGATPWVATTHDELRAAGARQRRETPGDALSAQEERVARAAAEGATTREIAEAMFLAPKTVEFHLGRVYRKLGVHSRAALATSLARRPPD